LTVLDFILNGIEAELALERELGVRSIECDRSLLSVTEAYATQSRDLRSPNVSEPRIAKSERRDTAYPPRDPEEELRIRGEAYSFVFLHDKALSEGGVAMMAKIITAMGKTPESAPIVFTGDLPPAKVHVVLGGKALKKWFPSIHAGPNVWVSHEGKSILVTYSPEHILRFGEVTPDVKKIKAEMWNQLKAVSAKVRST